MNDEGPGPDYWFDHAAVEHSTRPAHALIRFSTSGTDFWAVAVRKWPIIWEDPTEFPYILGVALGVFSDLPEGAIELSPELSDWSERRNVPADHIPSPCEPMLLSIDGKFQIAPTWTFGSQRVTVQISSGHLVILLSPTKSGAIGISEL